MEARAAVKAAYSHEGPVYLRLSRLATPVFHDPDKYTFEIGKGETLTDGFDIAVISTGLMTSEVLKAAVQLKKQGSLSVRVINMPCIKPLDEDLVLRAAKECKKIITVEEHSTIGGLGEAVCSLLAEKCPTPVRRLGVPDSYGHSGPAWEVLKDFGLPCRRRRRGHSGVRQGKGGITPKRQRAHSVYKNRHPPRAGACFALRVRFFRFKAQRLWVVILPLFRHQRLDFRDCAAGRTQSFEGSDARHAGFTAVAAGQVSTGLLKRQQAFFGVKFQGAVTGIGQPHQLADCHHIRLGDNLPTSLPGHRAPQWYTAISAVETAIML